MHGEPRRSSVEPVKRVRFAIIVLALVALAGLVRLPGLGRTLWYDERFTVVNFTDTVPHALFSQRAANNHPTASVLALSVRACSGLGADDDPRALRAPFVALGALGVLAIGWLVGGRGAAAAAAMLLAVAHPAHVGYSQEVRGYAALLVAAPLVAGLALEGRRPWLLAGVVALGLLSHLTLLAVVLAFALLAVRERAWRTVAGLAGGTLVAAVLTLPMLGHLGAFATRTVGTGGPDGLARTLALFTTGDARLLPPLLGAPLLALALVGALRARRLAFATGVALLVLAAIVLVARPVFYARFALSLLPLVLALAAHGAASLAAGRRALLVVLPLVVVGAIATNRRAARETEPIGPALREHPGARFEFRGLGAELHESAKDPTHRIELFAPDAEAQFHGLEASVKVTPLAPAKRGEK